MRSWLAVGAACVALAGCGGGSGDSSSTPSTSASPSASTATVRQYASLVAASSAPIRKNARQIHGCALAIRPATTCALYRLTAEFATKTLALRLRGAMARSSKVYIGPPPSEVAPLVQSTMADAQQLVRVVKDGHNDYGQVEIAQGRLLADLDGWRPYGA